MDKCNLSIFCLNHSKMMHCFSKGIYNQTVIFPLFFVKYFSICHTLFLFLHDGILICKYICILNVRLAFFFPFWRSIIFFLLFFSRKWNSSKVLMLSQKDVSYPIPINKCYIISSYISKNIKVATFLFVCLWSLSYKQIRVIETVQNLIVCYIIIIILKFSFQNLNYYLNY